MRRSLLLPLTGLIVIGLVVIGAWWGRGGGFDNDSGDDCSRDLFMAATAMAASAFNGCSCALCHDVHGGGPKLLKEHPGPKNYPLQCFDCHFPHDLVDEPECLSCHECGSDHAGLPQGEDCFDCHGNHDPDRPPDLSGQTNCFRCH